jgi:hypothetical protein
LLETLARPPPAPLFSPLPVVADTATIPHAQQVPQWLAAPPRCEGRSFPTSGPRANPLERALGDVHDKGPRHHTRKQMGHLVQEVKQPLRVTGPWRSALSEISYTPEVTATVEALQTADSSLAALSQLAA